MRRILLGLFVSAILFTLLLSGCGGSSSSSGSATSGNTSVAGGNTIVTSGNNVAALTVDAGPVPSTNPQVNVAFATVTVCSPGSTTNCVTLDHVAVDTGSTGLRVPASLLSSLGLANVNPSAPVAECVQFLDNSFFFGSVRVADVRMGGANNNSEVASSVPIHYMGDPSIPTGSAIPSSCSTVSTISGTTTAGTEEDSVAALGANGLLGVGNTQYDCDVFGEGNPCSTSSTPIPAAYYTCPSTSSCTAIDVPVAQQLRNPVSLFSTDNNGVIIELPQVATGGTAGISAGAGSMVFGIGTQTNNGLTTSAVVLPVDTNPNDLAYGGISTVYNGVTYPTSGSYLSSFLDSGSTIYMFLDGPTTGIPVCEYYYCPTSTDSLTATNTSTSGASHAVQFNVTNANTLFSNNGGNDTAFSDLGAPNSTGTIDSTTKASDGFFDWGLPFFYGRNVYVGISGVAAPATPASGTTVPAGPFWAY